MSDWALCVGIGSYMEAARLDSLPGALNDARAIHDWLVDPQGGAVPKDQAKLILSPDEFDQDDPKPIEHDIDRFLRKIYRDVELRRRNGQPGFRRLWLYYSGHGIGFPDDDHDVGLLTADAQPPFRDFPHVAGKAWAEVFRVTKAFEELVLFMDCCRLEMTRTALRKPAVRTFLANPEGKMMAAFAVSPSKAAYEVPAADGKPRGRFTTELEKLLKQPPSTPMWAREFLDQLEHRAPGIDPFPPRSRVADFEFLPEREPDAEHASLLIAHGETTADLAGDLSAAMRTRTRRAQVKWAPDVVSESNPDAFSDVRELVVTRDLTQQDLKDLVTRVKPRRTVVYGKYDPGVAELEGVRFVPRPDDVMLDLSKEVGDLDAALAEPPGFLEITVDDPLVKVRVWDEHGQTVAQGFGGLAKHEVSPGTYFIRAALGPYHVEEETQVDPDQTRTIELPALPLRLPSKDTLMEWHPTPAERPRNRLIVEVRTEPPLIVSVPDIPGWQFEAFSLAEHASSLSLRLVPDAMGIGVPHESDKLRESLRLALAERAWDASNLTVESVASDPLCALLAAALRLKCGLPHEAFADAAAEFLGDDDPDIQLLRGPATIEAPPLLSFLWHFRLNRHELVVTPKSSADGIVDGLQLTEPWLSWTEDTAGSETAWVNEVANTLWPGWDDEPDTELALPSIKDATHSLGAPADSIKRNLRYKSPPIDRLVQHQEAAFVGATNGQLPAALVVAFVERGKQPWKRLEVWSLTDESLREVNSDNRTPGELIAERNWAEGQLLKLLEEIAEEWSLNRYDKLEIQYQSANDVEPVWCFASLWDWKEQGGFVHVSPHTRDNVRTADFQDLIWRGASQPTVYRAVADAYQQLQAVEVLGNSQH